MPLLEATKIGVPGVRVVSTAEFTGRDLIVARLAEHDTAGIIGELSHVLQRSGRLPDVLPFYQAALNQELLANSANESGIAFPHARVAGIQRVQFAFGRTPGPVIWGAKGSLPVDLVFLLAVPATDAAVYLHLRAGLARLGQQPEVLTDLRQARSAAELYSIFHTLKISTFHS